MTMWGNKVMKNNNKIKTHRDKTEYWLKTSLGLSIIWRYCESFSFGLEQEKVSFREQRIKVVVHMGFQQ